MGKGENAHALLGIPHGKYNFPWWHKISIRLEDLESLIHDLVLLMTLRPLGRSLNSFVLSFITINMGN